jgi:hypothetical protein
MLVGPDQKLPTRQALCRLRCNQLPVGLALFPALVSGASR